MKFAANELDNLIPRISRTFVTEFGEKVGDYFFSPLRKYTFSDSGVKRWYWPRLVVRPNEGTGFAAVNMGDEPATYENIAIPPKQAVLVAHSFETMAARIRVTLPGTYFVIAFFRSTGFEASYHVNFTANGKRLWDETISSGDCQLQHAQFVRMTSTGFFDFAINTDRASQTLPSRAFIQYAIIRCDDDTGALQLRYDDCNSDIADSDIVAIHAQTAFETIEIPAAQIGIEQRAELLKSEWTLHPEYLESQYQCSPQVLVERVLSNRGPAKLKYCIFMIPRSGSTLLTELLASTAALGFPGESFVPDVIRTLSLTFSDQFNSYEEFLTAGLRSENGVFGIEVEHERLQEEHQFFKDLAEWRHVYIWRKDLLAQAISYQVSIETGVWHSFVGSSQDDELRYISRADIVAQVNSLLRAERFFRDFFATNGMAPYSICFEDLISDQVGHARKIADHIGIDSSSLKFVNENSIQLRPTSRARNAYYKQLAICSGGELWGYDIHQISNRWYAVLHGVDPALLDFESERLPVVFAAEDRQALCNNVQEFVVRQIATLPPLSCR